jgi:choline-sulfatase
VPLLMSHPGRIPTGTVQPAMASAYDFMPTLLDYLGLPLPTGRNLPGQSFVAALRGQEDAARENVVVYDEYGATRMVRTAEWKYVQREPHGPHELYDLVDDPDERHNQADDPQQSGRIEELKAVLEAWFARYVEAEKDGRDYQVTGKGQLRPVGGQWTDGEEPFAQE